MKYIWENPLWPNFSFDKKAATISLENIKTQYQVLNRVLTNIGFDSKQEIALRVLTNDALGTSEVENEHLEPQSVRSSIGKRLGLAMDSTDTINAKAEGIVSLRWDATRNAQTPLTHDRFFSWNQKILVNPVWGVERGKYRSGYIAVLSGQMSKEKVHFEAVPHETVFMEMEKLIVWSNSIIPADNLVIASAIAHLWFVTIHPFGDGNGRMARNIGDLFMARLNKDYGHFVSLSDTIQKNRSDYYKMLESTQKGGMDITPWIDWYDKMITKSIENTFQVIDQVMEKKELWAKLAKESLNARQIKMVDLILEDWKGNLTSSKWAEICKCSQDTATRDIEALIKLGFLQASDSKGRSTHYTQTKGRQRHTRSESDYGLY